MLNITISLLQDSSLPLYEQLYSAIARQIREGNLTEGQKLPGKREMAAQLAVSVNTVDTAYSLLTAEGWLQAKPKSGFYVLPYEQPLSAQAEAVRPALREPPAKKIYRFDLSTGGVDTNLFPFRTWGRIQKELLYTSPQLLNHGPSQGDEELRAAIARHLEAYRGVQCAPEQIVVGAGIEYLLGLVAPLLKGSVAIENPGYHRTGNILRNSGLNCLPVGIDEKGLNVAQLAQTAATVAYVTPSHQFPTGVTMPAGRRAALLKWAASEPGRWIIEDDYDSEFRFDIRPLPSLQGMGGAGSPVIYLTTFSKSLAPSIRIAAMVLPHALLEPFARRYEGYSCTVSRFEQQTLCRFMDGGYFARHLSRLRNEYRNRVELLCTNLRQHFGSTHLTIQGAHTGLHLLLTLKDGPGEPEMIRLAEQVGIPLSPLSHYYLSDADTCPPNTVVLGYAALPSSQVSELAELLKAAWLP